MKFNCVLFNQEKFLFLVFSTITIMFSIILLANYFHVPMFMFLTLLLGTILLIIFFKVYVEKKFKKEVCFEVNENSFIIKNEKLINDTITNNNFIYSSLSGYKISIAGNSIYYYLKIYFKDGRKKSSFLLIKTNECSEALESLNLKILEYNKADSNIEKIKLIPDFYITEKGLWLIRICVAILIFAVIRLFIYQSKSSLMSILILFASVAQIYGTRRSQFFLYSKLINGEPLT
ncbi:MAG: hypothetical protein EAZ13_07370 [Sphingobacteriia bacterium]|nr:MAG: hypothetical protein EAZ13_07370 [Sphingobacteriia bacterium]